MSRTCSTWRKPGVLVLALLLVVAAACGGDSTESGPSSGGAGNDAAVPDPDATLVHLTASTLAAGFSPFQPNNPILDYQWQSLVYDGLFKLSPDLSGVEPALAREWEFSEDGLQLTITLQEGVTFQDGTDLTADVVAQNLAAQQEEGANGALLLTSVTDVTAVDDTTVQITLSEPNPTILFVLSTVTGIIVSEAGLADREELKAEPQGSGPYQLVSSDAALNYRYEKWDGYWNEEVLAAAPAVVTVASVPDSSARANAIRTGGADYVFAETGQLAEVQADDNLQVIAEESISPLALLFNNDMAPFDNPAAAQAINIGLDREAFNAVVDGGCPPAYQTFPDGLEGHLDGVTVERDLERAQELVADAGLEGSTILLENLGAGSNVDSARLFQPVLIAQLEEMGFKVELGEPVDRSLSRTVWQEGKHALVVTSTPSTVPSSSIYVDSYALGPNQVGTPDPELQAMQDAAKVLPLASDERDAAYAEINQYLLDDPAYVPLCAPINVHVGSSRVIGLDEIPNRRVSQAGDFSGLRIAKEN